MSPLYLICNREDEPSELNEGRKMERNDAAGRGGGIKSVVKFNLKCSGEDKQVGQSGGEENWEERRERGRQDGELINRSLYARSCVFFLSPLQHTDIPPTHIR